MQSEQLMYNPIRRAPAHLLATLAEGWRLGSRLSLLNDLKPDLSTVLQVLQSADNLHAAVCAGLQARQGAQTKTAVAHSL